VILDPLFTGRSTREIAGNSYLCGGPSRRQLGAPSAGGIGHEQSDQRRSTKLFLGVRMGSPSLIPDLPDAETYLVLDDFGKLGRAYREADPDTADRDTVVQNLLRGEYNSPISIIAFNLAEGRVWEVSEDVARDVVELARLNFERLPEGTEKFVERQLGEVSAWPVF
jgi:hypothetical protein